MKSCLVVVTGCRVVEVECDVLGMIIRIKRREKKREEKRERERK